MFCLFHKSWFNSQGTRWTLSNDRLACKIMPHHESNQKTWHRLKEAKCGLKWKKVYTHQQQRTVQHATPPPAHTHTCTHWLCCVCSASAGCSVGTSTGTSSVHGVSATAMAGPQCLPQSERKSFRGGKVPHYFLSVILRYTTA